MTVLIGRNHRREVFMQYLRDKIDYKPSVYKAFYDQYESIFIHIPKNAGTSVAKALYGCSPWHWTAADLFKISKKRYQGHFKFAIVRNPLDRLFSTFCYAPRDVEKFAKSPLRWVLHYPDFESFVMDGLTKEIADRHYFIGSQLNYLRLPNGVIDHDIMIGKFEEMNAFLNEIVQRLPRLAGVGMENVSPKLQPLQKAYTTEMIDHVRELYAHDIEEFSYQFPKQAEIHSEGLVRVPNS